MDKHRLIAPSKINVIPFDAPFSSFDFVEDTYGWANYAIRRLFSIGRSYDARTLMIEEIEPAGIIADENDEIKEYAADHAMGGLHRISFWKSSFKVPDANVCLNEECIGYAILKHDKVSSKKYDRWHVFEAVFKKYPHPHNCVPHPMRYRVALGGESLHIEGLLYAQQNSINKVCAHVALRSLISRFNGGGISYRQINDIARQVTPKDFNPENGLEVTHIRAVLEAFEISYRDFDYKLNDNKKDREQYPYQKYVYSGIESGAGALVGFQLKGL